MTIAPFIGRILVILTYKMPERGGPSSIMWDSHEFRG
jgi:hypothetical protein